MQIITWEDTYISDRISHWVGRELNEKKIQMESGHLAIAQIEVDLSCSP